VSHLSVIILLLGWRIRRGSEFITELEKSDYASSYLEDGALLKVTTAYWAFMGCEKDEVKAG
jgi:hypothetical protein